MPVVEFDTREVLTLLGGDVGLEGLEEEVPMLGVGLEELTGDCMQVEVFPNRPDMLGVEGFARALRGYLGIDAGFIDYEAESSGFSMKVDGEVAGVRPFISTAVVRDMDFSDESLKSLMNIQEKLHVTHGRDRLKVAVGVHDLDKIKPDFTYTAKSPQEVSFAPLDGEGEMNMRKILSRHPKGRDYAWTLEGLERYPVIYDGRGEVLSFPPIINGEYSRLEESTRNIFIECTGSSQLACDQAVNIIVSGLADRGARIETVNVVYP